jgi:17beta-estradiol 17-dehydrogenase / very-long-chain 3-oxoacyl-CoA reductase
LQIKTFVKGDRPAYAIITGPTSGIGKAYAHALAKARFNLILVSRSESKLEALKDELAHSFPLLDIRLVATDIGEPLSSVYGETLKDVVQTGDIRVLVNNAGMSHDIPVTFAEMTESEMEGIVGVNTCGVLRITKETLPYLLSDPYPLSLPSQIATGINWIGRRRD